jgi:hypothetical protein
MVVATMELPGGLSIVRKIPEGKTPSTDYELVDRYGDIAELETKAWHPRTWTKWLAKADAGDIHGSLVKLVNSSRARIHAITVSTSLSPTKQTYARSRSS